VDWMRAIAPHLADVQLLFNASVIESEAQADTFTVPPPIASFPIPGTRRLQGQSPYVINVAGQFENDTWGVFRLLYNIVGPTLVAAAARPGGGETLFDIIQEPHNQLDFVWLVPFTLFGTEFTGKFAVDNILNDVYLQTQGDETVERYRRGATFALGVSYSF